MEEKKSRYSEAQNRATQKYIKENLEEIRFRVKKGEKDKYKDAAEKAGMSMAKFFLTAADEKIEREQSMDWGKELVPDNWGEELNTNWDPDSDFGVDELLNKVE